MVICNIDEFADGENVFIRKEAYDEAHSRRIFKILRDENNEYNGNYGLIFGKNCQGFTANCFNI